MRETGKHFDKTSISSRLRALILQLAVPLSLLSLFVVLVFLLSSLSLAQVSRNISTASRFNQNFKDEVDLKMYYFVTGSDDQLPWDEVQAAGNFWKIRAAAKATARQQAFWTFAKTCAAVFRRSRRPTVMICGCISWNPIFMSSRN